MGLRVRRDVGPAAREADPQRRPRPRGPHRGPGGAVASSSSRRVTTAGQENSASTRRRPAAPMARAGPGRPAGRPRAGDRPGPAPVDHRPGLPLDHRLGGAARAPGHHRQAGRGRLQEHHPEGLQVQPQPAGAARHGEHVAGGVVGRQVLPGDLAGQVDAVGDRAGRGQPAQPPLVGPAADQQQPRLRHPGHHPRPGLDEPVLALAGHQPGDADADRRRPEPVALAHPPPVDRRVVGVGVDAGREQLDRAAAAHRPGTRAADQRLTAVTRRRSPATRTSSRRPAAPARRRPRPRG